MKLQDNRTFLWFMFLSLLSFLIAFSPVSVSKASVYDYSSKYKVVKLDDAKRLVKHRFGNINDIDIVLNDLTKVLQKSNFPNENRFRTVVENNVIFEERSYIFLVVSSVAFSESRFDIEARGKLHEIGTYQLLPSTVKALTKEHTFPFKLRSVRDLTNEQCTILAVYYIQKHLTDENGNIVTALSKYNGDKTKRYGNKVGNVFRKTLATI